MILSDKKQKSLLLLASIFFVCSYLLWCSIIYSSYLSAASSTWTKFWSQRGGRRKHQLLLLGSLPSTCPYQTGPIISSFWYSPSRRMHYYHGGLLCMYANTIVIMVNNVKSSTLCIVMLVVVCCTSRAWPIFHVVRTGLSLFAHRPPY